MPFSRLENLGRIEGRLELLTDLASSTGRADLISDAPLHWDPVSGRPFIPGSSLKGAFRAQVGRLAHAFGLSSCGVFLEARIRDEPDCVSTRFEPTTKQAYATFSQEGREPSRLRSLSTPGGLPLCHACGCFGSVAMASRVRFPDLHVAETEANELLVSRVDDWSPFVDRPGEGESDVLWNERPKMAKVRHGVGIDRETGAARAGIRFDVEAMLRSLQLDLVIVGENLRPADRQLLAIGLRLLLDGDFYLGGRTTRGLGRVRLQEEGASVKVVASEAQLRSYVKGGWAKVRERSLRSVLRSWLRGGE